MPTLTSRSRSHITILIALLLTTLLVLAGCGVDQPSSAFDLDPFRAMANEAGCADVTNRLFVIDDELVFWDVAGNCADASYAQTLYGSTPDQVLCTLHDSIAGPQQECQDAQYQEMFATITSNLNKPDLGLGAGHTVQEVSF
jgi:hypothetical protein